MLSGAANPERAHTAMAAVDKRLVRREHGVIQLLDPPFDRSELDRGYVEGYVPGLRLEVDRLHLAPCLPAHWTGLIIHYPYRETVYHIAITQVPAGDGGTGGAPGVTLDGAVQEGLTVPLVDDRQEHRVEVRVVG